MDATSTQFVEYYLESGRRSEWVVMCRPYKDAISFLRKACIVARVGVALKQNLKLLVPVASRAQWLTENPTSHVILMSRSTYRGRLAAGVKAWFVWKVIPAKGGGCLTRMSHAPRVTWIYNSDVHGGVPDVFCVDEGWASVRRYPSTSPLKRDRALDELMNVLRTCL